MDNSKNFCVIMAGGIGSRFWPMSKTQRPKQFLDILGIGRTLIQQTYDRFTNICPAENFYVVTNDLYKDQVLEQLPDLKPEQILCEPFRRNTAPCIAYAHAVIAQRTSEANIMVAPADHIIMNQPEFERIIGVAINEIQNDCLVTLGIKPSRPDTGYGYIQFEDGDHASAEIKTVKTFTEKPNHELAVQFVETGEFYWNSGIFLWTLDTITKEFKTHLSEINDLFESVKDDIGTDKQTEAIKRIYEVCTDISIDYGIMEKAEKVVVVLSDFGWSDLGTWGSLYTHLDKDEQENAVIGDNVMLYDSSNCVVNVPKDKLVVLQGLDNYICVESDDVLLVCKKEDEQKIKVFVSDVKRSKNAVFT